MDAADLYFTLIPQVVVGTILVFLITVFVKEWLHSRRPGRGCDQMKLGVTYWGRYQVADDSTDQKANLPKIS
jgi:hypothetical protein